MSSSLPPPGPPESAPPPPTREGLPPPLPRQRKGGRPWGPTRVLLGLLAVVVIAVLEAGIVIAIEPPPPFEPVAVATASPGGQDLFVLNVDADTVWVMQANGSDALHHSATVPVPAGSAFLAAGSSADGTSSVLAVAGRNDKGVTLIRYTSDGASERLRTLPINDPGACAGEIRKQQCTGVRSLAIGDIGAGDRPALAVGTLGGQVRIFDLAGANRLQRTITIRGNRRIVEALAIGQLDSDSHADLLVRAQGGVVPYLGSSSGTLTPLLDKRLREIPQALAIGELGPGNVALAPRGSDHVQVLSWDEQSGFVRRSRRRPRQRGALGGGGRRLRRPRSARDRN